MTSQDVFIVLAGIFLALCFIYLEMRKIRKLIIAMKKGTNKTNNNEGGSNGKDYFDNKY